MAQASDAFRSVSATAAAIVGGAMLMCACTITTRVVDRIDENSAAAAERSVEAPVRVESAQDLPELVVSDDAVRRAPPFDRALRANVRTVSIRHFRQAADRPMAPDPVQEPAVSAASEPFEPTYEAAGIGASSDATVTSLLAGNDVVAGHEAAASGQVVSVEERSSAQWRRGFDHVLYTSVAWKHRFDEFVALDRRWTWAALFVALAGIAWLTWRIRRKRRRWFFGDLSG